VIAPPQLLDPFEHELTLSDDPRVVSFSRRGFEIPLEDLAKNLAYDLVGRIPRPLGKVKEEIDDGKSPFSYGSAFFQIGDSVLALCTEIDMEGASHRVLELLGIAEDVRVRLNLTLHNKDAVGKLNLSNAAKAVIEEGRALGQARVWGSVHGTKRAEIRRTLHRQMTTVGMDSKVLDRSVTEPTYKPPAAARISLDAMPSNDLRVADLLLELLASLPVEGADVRNPRRISAHNDRIRDKGSIVSFRYETHRAATGVLHIRRREVEAGLERPGLVRTFNVAGLRGAGRLRIRDVGGRVSAEFAGSQETVDAIRNMLVARMGGRTA
jgi:hypothetical protein